LLSAASPIVFNGVSRNADATLGQPFLPGAKGAVALTAGAGPSAAVLDVVGWTDDAASPSLAPRPIAAPAALASDEQYVRLASPAGIEIGIGRAYNSGDNGYDFEKRPHPMNPARVTPHNTASATELPIAGRPAEGAVVSIPDGLSAVTRVALTGAPPRAAFTLQNVVAGRYTVLVASGNAAAEITGVVVEDGGTTDLPNAATSPSWPLDSLGNGVRAVLLERINTKGFVAGRVVDINGAVVPGIRVDAGAVTPVDSSGRYMIPVEVDSREADFIKVVANPLTGVWDRDYNSPEQLVALRRGQVTSGIDFQLIPAGTVEGRVTRGGGNPLPGIAVVIKNKNGVVMGQAVSDAGGWIRFINLPEDTDYKAAPVLEDGEMASPSARTFNVRAGRNVDDVDFAIANALGVMAGAVTVQGEPLETGAMILATRENLTGPAFAPPALGQGAGAADGSYYTTVTDKNGAFQLRAPDGAGYNVYAYYQPRVRGASRPPTSAREYRSVRVTAGQTTPGVNFAW